MKTDDSQRAVIIGAGPAGGLTAAYELLKETDIQLLIMEQSDTIGGISQTVEYNGNRMDIGRHRFFSKNQRVIDFWEHFTPQCIHTCQKVRPSPYRAYTHLVVGNVP